MSNLEHYLTTLFKNRINISLCDIFNECGLDQDDPKDNTLLSKIIRRNLKLYERDALPEYYKIRRAKSIICECLTQ